MDEHVVKTKRDLKKVSERAKKLKVNCVLDRDDATHIMRRCRLLEEVIFDYNAFRRTDPGVKKYLNQWVFVESE